MPNSSIATELLCFTVYYESLSIIIFWLKINNNKQIDNRVGIVSI